MSADGRVVPPVAALLDLTDQAILVTGASGGIGTGIARRLHEAGATVILHAGQRADAVSVLAAELGERTLWTAGDLVGPGAPGLVGELARVLGDRPLTAVVNAAGIQPVAPLLDLDAAAWAAVLAADVTAAAVLTTAAARHWWAAHRPGVVVHVGSIEGIQPAVGHAHYAAAKAALAQFVRAAAVELGPSEIRVNLVAPGLVHRPGLEQQWPEGVARWHAAAPLGRLGRPDDVADACLFLVSPMSRWVTGAVVVVDGGVSARSTW